MDVVSRPDDKILRESMYIKPEAVDPDRHITAKYYVEGHAPMTKMAEEAAIENSTGTWALVGYETLEVRKKFGRKYSGSRVPMVLDSLS